MYQINTYAPLAASKEYFLTKKEVYAHLDEVIKITNDFLKKQNKLSVKLAELEDVGVSILKTDEEVEPTLMKMLGRPRRISLHNIDGSKKPPKDYEDLFASEHNGIRTKKVATSKAEV